MAHKRPPTPPRSSRGRSPHDPEVHDPTGGWTRDAMRDSVEMPSDFARARTPTDEVFKNRTVLLNKDELPDVSDLLDEDSLGDVDILDDEMESVEVAVDDLVGDDDLVLSEEDLVASGAFRIGSPRPLPKSYKGADKKDQRGQAQAAAMLSPVGGGAADARKAKPPEPKAAPPPVEAKTTPASEAPRPKGKELPLPTLTAGTLQSARKAFADDPTQFHRTKDGRLKAEDRRPPPGVASPRPAEPNPKISAPVRGAKPPPPVPAKAAPVAKAAPTPAKAAPAPAKAAPAPAKATSGKPVPAPAKPAGKAAPIATRPRSEREVTETGAKRAGSDRTVDMGDGNWAMTAHNLLSRLLPDFKGLELIRAHLVNDRSTQLPMWQKHRKTFSKRSDLARAVAAGAVIEALESIAHGQLVAIEARDGNRYSLLWIDLQRKTLVAILTDLKTS